MRIATLLCAAALAVGGVSCVKNVRKQLAAGGKLRNRAAAVVAVKPQPAGEKLSYYSVPVPGPFIAMTFDDGPVPKNTPRLLDMLAARGIKATFFTVGQNAAAYPNIIRRIVADGHELANHTWTHPWLTRLSDDAARLELQRSHDALLNIAGVAPRMYRPPYGAISTRHEQWIKQEFGYPTIIWSVDCGDSKSHSTASSVRANILRETRPGAIILVHDLHSWSVDAMPGTLDDLLVRGYRFVTMSQLLAMSTERKPQPAPLAVAPGPSFSPGSF
jgi:peptidoglycan/xylan/chitin deacetylase (PgdA/CDA1 family)